MFPEETQFDEIGKRMLELGRGELLFWMAGLSPDHMSFVGYLATELTLPGFVQRICDEIAHLIDHFLGGIPVAGLVEIQTYPDFDMFDRIGLAGHLFRLQKRPSPLPGDRWSLIGIIINLTGDPNSSRTLKHPGAEWSIQFRECNLQELDAWEVLDEIVSGKAPKSASAFISLMKKGGEPATIQRWLEVTADIPMQLRREFAGACVVFAELTNCQSQWISAVEDFDMIRSKFLTQIEEKGQEKGNIRGRVEFVLRALQKYTTVPADLEHAIRECSDQVKLDSWLDLALDRIPLEEFRAKAGI